MDSTSFQGFVLDPSKCSKLSMDEKRELVHEVSEWAEGAPELLQSWSRQDLLQVLCAEMGKERKYTGLTKLKIIEILLKVVADKKALEDNKNKTMISHERVTKRQKKSDHLNHPNITKDASLITIVDCDSASSEIKKCKNSACRANLSQKDAFCKRCSCCICHKYDDNKDPSLWLICSSEFPYQGTSCGLSCHLECALQNEKSGIPKDGHSRGLDGGFYCVSCGKVNDLLQSWRKQMMVARDTRRVDILCYRVSLSHKLLKGTLLYQSLDKIVKEVIQKLEEDVGPLMGLPVKCARGIVNRLASGQDIQKLCAFAVDSLDCILSNAHDSSIKGHLSNHSSVEDENKNMNDKQTDKCKKQENNMVDAIIIPPDDEENGVEKLKEFDPFILKAEGDLTFTPSKEESLKDRRLERSSDLEVSKDNLDDGSEREHFDKSLKKRSSKVGQDSDFEYYVKVIRWLECEKHIDTSFRQKFLTWYSLRATPQEVRIVKVFVDTFLEDPESLAEQLLDTFSEAITTKKCKKGLCLKLFH